MEKKIDGCLIGCLIGCFVWLMKLNWIEDIHSISFHSISSHQTKPSNCSHQTRYVNCLLCCHLIQLLVCFPDWREKANYNNNWIQIEQQAKQPFHSHSRSIQIDLLLLIGSLLPCAKTSAMKPIQQINWMAGMEWS